MNIFFSERLNCKNRDINISIANYIVEVIFYHPLSCNVRPFIMMHYKMFFINNDESYICYKVQPQTDYK